MKKIKGEYWIIGGDATYVDGNVGDTNHEGYALEHLRRKVLEGVGILDDDFDWDEVVKEIPEAILDSVDFAEMPEDPDALEMLLRYAEQIGLPAGDIDHAFERRGDVRTYMAKTYGWIMCHGNRLAVWHLTRDAAEEIADAVANILYEEASWDDEEPDAELEILVAASGKTYATTLQQLLHNDFSDIGLTEIEPPVGRNAQVAQLDLNLELPCYQGKPA